MIKNGKGGGNTKTGLIFEGETDLATFLSKQPSYSVDDGVVYYEGKKVARIFKKYGFYKFLAEKGVDWKKIISKRLLPDDSIYVIINNTLFIIECKYQQVNGSVDEKLQTCDFKRKEYQKLMAPLNIEVEYIYLLAEWFVTPGEYVKLEDKLRDQYEELLSRQVENKVDIYYHEKLLRQHSIGQRASALILFILTQDDNDIIIIDQPEDDLDNKVIYDEVITAIGQKKPYMQFIFATHNANIPVLGDSERVLIVEFHETKIDVAQGNIDLGSTHKQIVDIMEGGKEAFDKRQLIYTSWQ